MVGVFARERIILLLMKMHLKTPRETHRMRKECQAKRTILMIIICQSYQKEKNVQM